MLAGEAKIANLPRLNLLAGIVKDTEYKETRLPDLSSLMLIIIILLGEVQPGGFLAPIG